MVYHYCVWDYKQKGILHGTPPTIDDCAVVLSATKHVIALGGTFLSGFLSIVTGLDSILKCNKTSHHGPCVARVYASAFLSELESIETRLYSFFLFVVR